jgi:hypothetical protein
MITPWIRRARGLSTEANARAAAKYPVRREGIGPNEIIETVHGRG